MKLTPWLCPVFFRFLPIGLVVALALFVGAARGEEPSSTRKLEFKGQIEAYEQVNLCARIAGYVKAVHVDIGDRVKKGDLLVDLDAPELREKLTRKNARLIEARARVEQARQAVLVAEATMKTNRNRSDEAKAALQKAKDEAARWKAEKERANWRVKGGVDEYDKETVDEIAHQAVVAEEGVKKAQSRFDAAHSCELESAALRNKAEADVAVAEAEVTVAKAAVDYWTTYVDFAQIRAPFDGIVTSRLATVGQYVNPQDPKSVCLCTVARFDKVRVMVQVPELCALSIQPGIRANIRLAARQDWKTEATVTRTAMVLDPTNRTMRAEIDLPNADMKLRPGMIADVELLVTVGPGK